MSLVEFTVNGNKCTVTNSTPRDTTLSAYIRYALALPGTKAMCRQAGCGACIVSVRARRYPSGAFENFAVNACMVLVFSCHGWEITTIEALGNRVEGYNEIQKRMATFNATQCGYCTPGWVMSIHSLLKKHPNMTMAELEKSFGSNTCRCTGYRPILDAVKSFAIDATPHLQDKVIDIEDLKICNKTKDVCQRRCSTNSDSSDWSVISDLTDPIEVKFKTGLAFVNAFTEEQIFQLLRKFGTDSYMLADGNTAKCIEEFFVYPKVIIDISGVDSLKHYHFDQNLVLGANISLEDCIKIFKDTAATRSDEFSYLDEFADHFEMIAHVAVRNIGSTAGNLMTKRKLPYWQSDVFILLAAVGAMVTIRTIQGQIKYLKMEEFLKYNMKGALIINILLPPLSKNYIFKSYKVMPRNQNALAIVNAAYLMKLDICDKVEEVRLIYGNIASNFIHAAKTEAFLKGKDLFNNKVLRSAINILNNEVSPDDRPPEPSPACRRKLAVGLFYKFILSISPPGLLSPRFRSGGTKLNRPLSRGSQDFQTDPSLYPLNEPRPKYEGTIQSSGEATYANDIPPLPRQVFAAFVTSTIHVGEIDEIDSSAALDMPGVIAVYAAKDIPGKNSFAVPPLEFGIIEEEEILASKNVKFYGQPIAIAIGETEKIADDAAKKVKVTYKNVSSKPPVLTIDEAKKESNRLVPSEFKIDPKGEGSSVKKVVKGVYQLEGQYHYYLEPITTVVVPVDQGLEVYDATQWIDLTQSAIAQTLNMKESQIVVKVRRLGGGFGGKTTRNIQVSTACALVASKLDRPCRFILPLQTNLSFTGKRLPCQCEYEVGVDDVGEIQYLHANILEDKGYSKNDNVLLYTISGFKNCYNTDYFSVKSGIVLTDLPSNTVMRAPGTTEGIASIEHIMEHIAHSLNKDVDEVRDVNISTEHKEVSVLMTKLKQEANFDKRSKEIKLFNQANRWMKKAIKTSVMAYSLVYQGIYSAFVSVYKVDGSVTIATGGIEMGQGVNTKARQVCAYELGIPIELVQVLPQVSYTAANNAVTARSLTSECVYYAVMKACKILKERLQPVKEKNPNASWEELVYAASKEGIDLMIEYTMTDKEPDLSSYYSYGVAILETQLDVLTGRFEILRVDILEDVGLSVNPAVDIGQIEGAFVQGLGYFTSEKLIYDQSTGRLLTNRSLNYHVPLSLDIPADFRIKFKYNSRNPKGVLGSKATGEMGMCLTYVITQALRQCIYESRKDSGHNISPWLHIGYLKNPVTINNARA